MSESTEPPSLPAGADSGLAVIVPAYREAGAVADSIKTLRTALAEIDIPWEIVVVDDGSDDGTGDEAEATGVRVVRHHENRGYGAALKTGICATRSRFVAICDADGTYPSDALPRLVARAAEADMVVGQRAWDAPGMSAARRPAKRVLTAVASFLAQRPIPDLNSGLRVMRREPLERFLAILPSGFSFTTTITLAMLCTDLRVVYEPIEYHARIGQSKIRPTHFFTFIVLVLRAILLFNPLRVFLPLGALCFLGGLGKFGYDVYIGDLSESAVMAMLTALMLWSLGFLADMISRLQLGLGRYS